MKAQHSGDEKGKKGACACKQKKKTCCVTCVCDIIILFLALARARARVGGYMMKRTHDDANAHTHVDLGPSELHVAASAAITPVTVLHAVNAGAHDWMPLTAEVRIADVACHTFGRDNTLRVETATHALGDYLRYHEGLTPHDFEIFLRQWRLNAVGRAHALQGAWRRVADRAAVDASASVGVVDVEGGLAIAELVRAWRTGDGAGIVRVENAARIVLDEKHALEAAPVWRDENGVRIMVEWYAALGSASELPSADTVPWDWLALSASTLDEWHAIDVGAIWAVVLDVANNTCTTHRRARADVSHMHLHGGVPVPTPPPPPATDKTPASSPMFAPSSPLAAPPPVAADVSESTTDFDTTRLERENTHARDARVRFFEAAHKYVLDGEHIFPKSVSGVWSQYFGTFDAKGIIRRKFGTWAETPNNKYYALITYMRNDLALSVDECRARIANTWTKHGTAMSTLGTRMHRAIELLLNNPRAVEHAEVRNEITSPEMRQFSEWHARFVAKDGDGAGYVPYRTEWSIYIALEDGTPVIAGQIDSLWRHTATGDTIMIDWKRTHHFLSPTMEFYRRGHGHAAELPDNAYWHYAVQQNLYAAILRRYYDIDVSAMYLLQAHPMIDSANCVRVKDLSRTVDAMLDDEIAAVRARVRSENQNSG